MWKPLIVSHLLAKFGDYRHCGTRYNRPNFHVTLQEHMAEGACDFMNRSSSMYISTLPSTVAIRLYDFFSLSRDFARPRDFMVTWLYG